MGFTEDYLIKKLESAYDRHDDNEIRRIVNKFVEMGTNEVAIITLIKYFGVVQDYTRKIVSEALLNIGRMWFGKEAVSQHLRAILKANLPSRDINVLENYMPRLKKIGGDYKETEIMNFMVDVIIMLGELKEKKAEELLIKYVDNDRLGTHAIIALTALGKDSLEKAVAPIVKAWPPAYRGRYPLPREAVLNALLDVKQSALEFIDQTMTTETETNLKFLHLDELKSGLENLEEERHRQEEAKRKAAEEQNRLEEAEAKRKAKWARRTEVQNQRRASGKCIMCGYPLGSLSRLIGRQKHRNCNSYKD
jgi:hypothetical protein